MPISKTFACKKHGEFDAFLMNRDDKVRCPIYGCRGKPKEMPSGPSLFSDRTKGADKTLDRLATDFKMTNIKSTREGENQSGFFTRNNDPAPRDPAPRDSAIWGGKGGMSMGSILGGNRFQSVRGEQVGINPKQAGVGRGPAPDPRATFRDPDNLKIGK
jgi:hypothetical protein